MIILEGPDNSGKTTLAKWLAKELNLEYRRPPTLSSEKGVDSAVFDWWQAELSAAGAEAVPGIYDRCTYISDPIYRLVSGRPPIFDEMDMMKGISKLVGGRAFFIFCLPDWTWSQPLNEAEKEAGGGLEYADMNQLRVIHWAYYVTYMLWSEIDFRRVMMWDPQWEMNEGSQDRERVLNTCKNYLRRNYGDY